MHPIPVADPDDPRLALYRGVRDPELLRAHGVFLAEGRLVVQRLLGHSDYRARSVVVTPAAHASLRSELSNAPCPVYLVEPEPLRQLAGIDLHRGCLAVGERGLPRGFSDIVETGALIVVLERVGNPDNVGGAFRNAAAFGASAMVLSPGCSDPLYRKAIRTSMGAALTLPFAVVDSWPGALNHLRHTGWTVVALTPASDAAAIGEVAAGAPRGRIALLAGHEGEGLSRAAQSLASVRARIPMAAGVDSLNLVNALAVALYELTREPTPPTQAL